MPTLAVNGTELYYEDTGPGSTGETIAFMHGLLWDASLFAPQIAALRDRYRCVAWDHRGQGRSASDRRHCIDMELCTQDAVALLAALGIARCHLAGLSMGGFVAMRLAARRPQLVGKLILIDTSADPEQLENVPRYRMLSRVARLLGPRIIAKRVAPIMLGASILHDPGRRAEVSRYLMVMTARRDVWRAVNGVIDRAGCVDELPQIAAPCLVLVGDEDVATTPVKAAQLTAAIRGARLVHIPRAGHSSTVESPREVIAAIEHFLRE